MDKNNYTNNNTNGDDFEEFKLPSFINEVVRLQQQFLIQITPMIEMQESINKLYKPVLDAQQSLENIIGPYLDIQNSIQQTLAPLKNIDWESLKEAAAERLKEIDKLLREQENSNWCLDVDLLDSIDEEDVDPNVLSNHVNANLEDLVKELIAEPIFKLHTSLIDESYSAYKLGFYKLCAFSLFAAFEHVIASWYDGNLTKENLSVDKKPKARKLYRKIENITKNEKEQDEFIKVFALSVLRMYQKTFSFIPEQLNKELNRNSIAHGYHDYNSITKTDILKLFQLLKASTILELISAEELHEQNADSIG